MNIDTINYDTPTLLAARRHIRVQQKFATSRIFNRQLLSSRRKFQWEEITDGRPCANWTVLSAPGEKIMTIGSDVKQFETGVIKMEENIDPERFATRLAGLTGGGSSSLTDYQVWTPERQWQAYVMEILRQQKTALSNRMELSGWELLTDGTLTIMGPGRTPIIMDMGRHADLTRVLDSSDQWDKDTSRPARDITNIKKTMRMLPFGGPLTLTIMGWAAWDAYENNENNKSLRNRDFASLNNGPVNINIGAVSGVPFEVMGRDSNGSPIIVFNDYYDKTDPTTGEKTTEPFMDARDVIFVGPNSGGVQCYSPVWNFNNNLQPTQYYQSMTIDPKGTVQSIYGEVNPMLILRGANNTARIRVVAKKEIT